MASISPESTWEFAEAIKSVVGKPTTKRRATVQSVDKDGTIWVQLPGSANTTPIASTGTNVSPGDTVLTELRGTSLHITENNSDPAVGTRQAGNIARQAAKPAVDAAKAAEGIAGEAKAIASATGQHFWDDDNGAHVTDVTRDEWAAAVEDNFSDYDPDSKPYHNQLLNSMGILLRTALNNLVSITRSAIAFYDGAGNSASNIVARFGSDGAQIGVADGAHSYLTQDYHSLQMVDKDGTTYFHVSDLRDASGYATLVEVVDNPDDGSYEIPVAFPPRSVDTTSVVIDPDTPDETAATVVSVQETQDGRGIITVEEQMAEFIPVRVTYQTDADSAKALTFGSRASGAAVGGGSFAAGRNVAASGTMAQAFGSGTIAQGEFAHAEGVSTGTSGRAAHAEGSLSIAGDYAHGEGLHGWATGRCSHAQNNYTVAASADQTAMGRYNVRDANDTYALIIGNGTGNTARSNAQAVRWNGLTDVAGRTAYPLFVYSTAPDEADLPVTPCFVLATDDYGLWYYDGQ
jgi:hypothetical protein